MKKKLTLTIFIIGVAFIGMSGIAHAKMDYQLLEPFPGFFSVKDTPTLPDMILAIYQFGIWTVGIAGLFMLTVGGLWYMTSAGNNATAENAKKIIADSLLGIIAALSAYLIVYVINPDLTKVDIKFTKVELEAESTEPGAAGGEGLVDVGDICKGTGRCELNEALATKLKTALNGQKAQITEGYPPTTPHKDSCHNNGTCADVNLTENKSDVQAVKSLYESLKNAGLNPLYESTNCDSYKKAGIKCEYHETMTAPSFHVEM